MLMPKNVYKDGNGTLYIQVDNDQEAREVRAAAHRNYGVPVAPTRDAVGLTQVGQVYYNPAAGVEEAVETVVNNAERYL